MGPGFRNPAFVQDDDPVRSADGVQAVGDDQGRPALRQAVEGLSDEKLALRVQAGGRLVHDEQGGILEEGAGYRKSLRLAGGEAQTPLSDLGVVAVRHAPDELRSPRQPARSTSARLASGLARRMFSSTLP